MVSKLNSNFGGLSFGLTEDGKPGWKDGADTVHPFSHISQLQQKIYEKQSGVTAYTNFYFDINISEDIQEGLLFVDSWINTTAADFTISSVGVKISQYFKFSTTTANVCALYHIKLVEGRTIRITQTNGTNYNNRFIKAYLLY